MRHRRHFRRLNRTMEHREALRRNMAQSLLEHGQITTTGPKAKNLRPFVERIVSLAVKVRRCADAKDPGGALSARRAIHKMMTDRSMIPADRRSDYNMMSDAERARTLRSHSGKRHRTGDPKGRLEFTAESVTRRLVETIAPRYMDRPGGYTRIIRLAQTRIGDSARLAILQLVGREEPPGALTKPGKSARRRRADARYSFAVKLAKQRSASPGGRTGSGRGGEDAAGGEA
ncbi:MAG: 50S ribosomal protein L17 [Planctomycetota bacterium]